jgi:arginyl-tRNA synthetase
LRTYTLKDRVTEMVEAALNRARESGRISATAKPRFIVELPKDPAHGDYATNVALAMAREEGKPARELAAIIRGELAASDEFSEVSVGGPGFINFCMARKHWYGELRRAAEEGEAFFLPKIGLGKKAQVEFLSANPTGPLTVGHGRNAVLGDTIARLYEAGGFEVTREYYFNNGGRQMKLLGASVRARYLEALGEKASFPEEGYQGQYIRDIAAGLVDQRGRALLNQTDLEPFRAAAEKAIFADIHRTCERLKIRFDVYTNELDLIAQGKVARVIAELDRRGWLIERDGAVWLRGEPLGLPKDEVLIRSGPEREPTYRTPDIAYHIDKLERGFDLIVGVFGADHIAEHKTVLTVLKALGLNTAPIRTVIYQFVTLTRGGQKVKMSTRKANYITLDELIDEVGADVARFFFLLRKSDSHLDFDLELATRQAPENPVFYVQYAHARLASVFREARKAGLEPPEDAASVQLELLSDEELELGKRIVRFPELIVECIEELEPHRLPFYLIELAGEFHRYYNKPTNRIISEQPELSRARLFLAGLIKQTLMRGLTLLGVDAPERM